MSEARYAPTHGELHGKQDLCAWCARQGRAEHAPTTPLYATRSGLVLHAGCLHFANTSGVWLVPLVLVRELGTIDGCLEYEVDEIVPIPAKCGKCKRNWIDADAIRAPSLVGCRCSYCGGKLIPHPKVKPVVCAARARQLSAIAEELRPLALAANPGLLALDEIDDLTDLPLFRLLISGASK